MFVQALAEYADTYLSEDLADLAFEEKPVRFLVELAEDGRFLEIVERTEQVQQGKKRVERVQSLMVPRSPVARNSGLHPLLACDDIKYVLGVGQWTEVVQRQNQEERHNAFVQMIQSAAEATGDGGLEACTKFYAQAAEVEKARERMAEKKAPPGCLVALSVGRPLVLTEGAHRYWCEHYLREAGMRSEKGGSGMCLITGETGPIAATHDKIKGMVNLGGQASGVSLMSFDKPAFRSYGWEQNANSPVSPGRAMAYVLALNDLLRGDHHKRVNHNGIGFLFWTHKPVNHDSIETIEQADPEQVKRLLMLDPHQLDLEENEFYLAGVSGNGGRMLIRYWMHETLGQVKRNMASYFRGLGIVDVFTKETVYPKMYQLLDALGRKGDEVPAQCAVQIIRRAIEGRPLGRMMLARALGRMRVASGHARLSAARAGLIKLYLNDLKGETPLNEELNLAINNPAYLCGRLLAVYEYIQFAAQGDLNASVTDRYYSLASANPALAFPKIGDLGMKHLRKLKRDKRGLAVVLDREIQDIHALIAAREARFPGALSLEDQGRFAIGYHQQRGAKRLQTREDVTVQSTEESN